MTRSAFDDDLAHHLLDQRIIFVGRELDDELAERVCAQLLVLAAQNPRTEITMLINSPGGSITAGLAVHDTMRLISNDIGTVAVGRAAGMGQVLLTAGTHGRRFALANAQIMLHQPFAKTDGGTVGIAGQADRREDAKRAIRQIIAEHTGQTYAVIEQDSDRERRFTASQALEYGMVDGVVTKLAEIRPAEPVRRMGL